jgi:hypothetical protein
VTERARQITGWGRPSLALEFRQIAKPLPASGDNGINPSAK